MNIFIEITSLSLGIISIAIALFAIIRTESYRRRSRIEINRVVDDAHSFRELLLRNDSNRSIEERINSFNHSLTVNLLGLDKKIAIQWIKHNKSKNEWSVWEKNLQIKIK